MSATAEPLEKIIPPIACGISFSELNPTLAISRISLSVKVFSSDGKVLSGDSVGSLCSDI
jgi:hypothetical protein